MKSTASRSPFSSSAIAVALASSLFALTACGGGGGGGDSSPASGSAGSASGGATTAVASNTHGSSGAGNSTASSGTQQGQAAAGGGSGQGAVHGGLLGGADPAGDVPLGSSKLSLEELLRIAQQEQQNRFVEGDGPGTQLARRIMAACPSEQAHVARSASMSDLLACVAGNYSGTDLRTGERCQVDISANGQVNAGRGSFRMGSFGVHSVTQYARNEGAIEVSFQTQDKEMPNGKWGGQSVAVYFDPLDDFRMQQLGLAEGEINEVTRQRMASHFVVWAANDYDDDSGEDEIVMCGIPR